MKKSSPLNNVLQFFLVDFLETVVITVAIAVVIYIFIAAPKVVDGDSMMPNFVNGEYLLINKLALTYSKPKRGDVIVFQFSPTEEYIKRIIGVPGDTLELENGYVYIDGRFLNESAYLGKNVRTYGMAYLANNVPIQIPKNEYFVMGDNRENSSDSREWGLVNASQIKGIVWFVFWPLNKFGFYPTVSYTVSGSVINSKLN